MLDSPQGESKNLPFRVTDILDRDWAGQEETHGALEMEHSVGN